MSDRDADPASISYVAFDGFINENDFYPMAVLGNVVAVPPDQLADFLASTGPATIEDFVDRHREASAHRLGNLAARHLIQGRPQEVTAAAKEVLTETQALIQDLPAGFKTDFSLGVADPPLRIQKTVNEDLLVGFVVNASAYVNPRSNTYLTYALFGADGAIKEYSGMYAHSMNNAGQKMSHSQILIKDQRPRLEFWMDYMPQVTRLMRAHQEGDDAAIETCLGAIYASNYGKKDISMPAFLHALDDDAKEALSVIGQLPKDVITRRLPDESVLEEMRFSNVARMAEALERWNVPYVEVSYTAGVREVSDRNLYPEMLDGQRGQSAGVPDNLLPATFTPKDVRNRNDLYARIIITANGDELAREQEVLLYDGSQYNLAGDYALEHMSSLAIPQPVREHVARMPQPDALRKEAMRPTRQRLLASAATGEGFDIRQSEATGEYCVIVKERELPLSQELAKRFRNVQPMGEGPSSSFVQKITVDYYRFGDELVPVAVDAVTMGRPKDTGFGFKD